MSDADFYEDDEPIERVREIASRPPDLVSEEPSLWRRWTYERQWLYDSSDGGTVVTHTCAELEQWRDRLVLQLNLIDSLPPRERVLDELGDVRFLLGEDDGE